MKAIARGESAVDACARMLREAILEGDLVPGEKLLPERDLAYRLGVNRVTIRSALGRLAAGGLLEVRQGSGHRVLDYRRVGGPELIPTLLSLETSAQPLWPMAHDLLLVRRTLMGGAIECLAEKTHGADNPSVTQIRRAVRALANEEDADRKGGLEQLVFDTVLDEAGTMVLPLTLNPVALALQAIPQVAGALAAEAGGTLGAWEVLVIGLEGDSSDPRALAHRVVAELARHDSMVLSRLPR